MSLRIDLLTLDVQWLRAEILGSFFNAVFLIALCVSIILEALTRFLDPPEITNPVLVLVVGAFGLLSNIVGLFVLGGHGHSHGSDDHSHGEEHDHGHEHAHNDLNAAEQGLANPLEDPGTHEVADENGPVADIFPEAVLARTSAAGQATPRHIRFNGNGNTAQSQSIVRTGSRSSNVSRGRQRGRTNSLRPRPLSDIDSQSIHPASFRQEIYAATQPRVDDDSSENEPDEETAVEDPGPPQETTPLLGDNNTGRSSSRRSRRDSNIHRNHNHNKPKKAGTSSHGHSHSDMGMRAMVLHVIGDMLGNAGVIATALIIWLTDWPGKYYADPAFSLFIAVIILKTALPLTFSTAKVLLQATPDHIDVTDVREDIRQLPGIVSCHHVHIWELSNTKTVASMHIQVAFPISEDGGKRYMELAKRVRKCLHAYGIHSATIQPEFCLDETHNHGEDSELRMDGPSDGPANLQPPQCGRDDGDLCLLDCVDNCVGKGCCSPKASAPASLHSHHDEGHHNHDHDEGHHNHDHGEGNIN